MYYGPALSGRTSSLQAIYDRADPQVRGELVSLKTRGDRTFCFDFLQLEFGKIKGLKPRFRLYTVPRQVSDAASRKLVLQWVEGVVFVAGSQGPDLDENRETFEGLQSYLRQAGHRPEAFPLVLQCNKQDLAGVFRPEEVKARLGLEAVPCFGSVATQGTGVFGAFKTIVDQVVRRLN